MPSKVTQQQYESILKSFCVDILAIEHAPEFPQSVEVTDEFKQYHAGFLDALRLENSAELGLQTVILGRILGRIRAPSDVRFCGGDFTQDFTKSISNSKSHSTNEYILSNNQENSEEPKRKRKKQEDLESRAFVLEPDTSLLDPFLSNYFHTQLRATKWFNDFLWYYTDTSITANISVINFEVKKNSIVSVYEHPDFFKVVVGLLSYYPFLKNKLELNCNGFCTSAVLMAATDVWILHFMIEQDKYDPKTLKKSLYISEKYSLLVEEEAMQVELCLKWAAERGLNNKLIFEQQKSQMEAAMKCVPRS